MFTVLAVFAVGLPKYEALSDDEPDNCSVPRFTFADPVVVAELVPANAKDPFCTLNDAVVETVALVKVADVATVGEPVEKLGIPVKDEPAVIANVEL